MNTLAMDLDQAALRTVINAVAMIRAQSARLGFAALKAVADGGAKDIKQIKVGREAIAGGLILIAGDTPVEGHAPNNLQWIRSIASAEPDLLDRFVAFDQIADELLTAAQRGDVTAALADRVILAGADDFYDATTQLMVLLWTDLENRRLQSVNAAKAAIEAAGKAFSDLSERAALAHILALNARIEAARAKEAAFGVIATEIGELADGISTLAQGAGQTLVDARSHI